VGCPAAVPPAPLYRLHRCTACAAEPRSAPLSAACPAALAHLCPAQAAIDFTGFSTDMLLHRATRVPQPGWPGGRAPWELCEGVHLAATGAPLLRRLNTIPRCIYVPAASAAWRHGTPREGAHLPATGAWLLQEHTPQYP